MTTVTNEQAAYVAGAIDGEGHIGIRRTAPDAGLGRRSPRYTFVIHITNTNRRWLEQLQQWFGGRLVQTHEADERRRDCYDLRFTAGDAKALLIRVMPHLVMKQRQAGLVLQYFELAATRRLFSVNAKPADPDVIAKQEAIYKEIKSLNLTRKVPPKSVDRVTKRCSVGECGAKHYGKGYCWIHYRKFIIRGGPAAHEKRCVVCGAEFVSRRVDAACCSRRCTDKRYYQLNTEKVKAASRVNRARRRDSGNGASGG